MKLKLVRITKIICFCMIAVLLVNGLTDLLKPKWLENRWKSAKTNLSYYELEKDSAEVVFFGASVISAAADPFQLYEEYGISSYNLGVMSQPMIATYYWFKEALETQNMKLAVIEIKSAGRSSEKSETKARKSYDYMNWGLNKIEYALDYKVAREEPNAELDAWSYLFPLSLYHTRWSELTYDDYDFFLGNNDSYTKGFSVLSTKFEDRDNFNPEKDAKGKYDGFEVDTDEIEEPNPVNSDYLDKLVELAKENNVELLFVKTPDERWNAKQHNYIQGVADKNDINFVDMNLKSWREENNFIYREDAADIIHVNINGAKKVSKFLGQYIVDNYDLTDYREGENSVKKDFESNKAFYDAEMKEGKLSFISNLDEYLEAINDEDNEIIIASGSNVESINFTENQKKLLTDLGVSKSIFESNEYGTNIVSIIDGKNTINKVEKQDEEASKSIVLGGTLSDGTDYSISASAEGSSVRLNDNEYSGLYSKGFNIIVLDKKLKRVVNSIYLRSNNNVITMYRGE